MDQSPLCPMKAKVVTLGCKVNQYEGRCLEELLEVHGYTLTEQQADLCVINSCSVTARADRKTKNAVKNARKENPSARLVLCGCYSESDEPSFRTLGVEIFVPPDRKTSLISFLNGNTPSPGDVRNFSLRRFHSRRAFLKIQDGCDIRCAFCKIPSMRGPSRSRPLEPILEETRHLVRFHPEIVLCGVNIGLYGKDLRPESSLPRLLDALLAVADLQRIRLGSLDTVFVTRETLNFLAHPAMAPHLHLSFQSGDDSVLKAMGKPDRTADYAAAVENARKICPHVAISCDILVGFPAEGEHQFQNTLAFLERIRPMRTHIFTFSPREGTPLSRTPGPGSREKKRRYRTVRAHAEKYAREYVRRQIQAPQRMVAEERDGEWTRGTTGTYLKVSVRERLPLGRIYSVIPVTQAANGIVAVRNH
ncbi:MAG: MiaB/RimO family radical SAM methylthiotransferase [Candidatus Omnitrophica bacterium]|nr:MiaB/RimO family radical SAM methylthiotransferase [Candidatus Omnitrophota bacterium]